MRFFFKKPCIFKAFVKNPCFVRLYLFTKGDLYCQFSSLFGNWDHWTIGTLGHWDLWIIWSFGQLRPLGNWEIRTSGQLGQNSKNQMITVIKDVRSDINESAIRICIGCKNDLQ